MRIREGISHHPPRIRPDAIEASVQAIAEILSAHLPNPEIAVRVVATGAMREAEIPIKSLRHSKQKTGIELEFSTVKGKPTTLGKPFEWRRAITQMDRLCATMDLGGGELRWIHIQRIPSKMHVPCLGAVRLTERWVEDPAKLCPTQLFLRSAKR